MGSAPYKPGARAMGSCHLFPRARGCPGKKSGTVTAGRQNEFDFDLEEQEGEGTNSTAFCREWFPWSSGKSTISSANLTSGGKMLPFFYESARKTE